MELHSHIVAALNFYKYISHTYIQTRKKLDTAFSYGTRDTKNTCLNTSFFEKFLYRYKDLITAIDDDFASIKISITEETSFT